MEEIRHRQTQRQISFSFQLRSKELEIKKENLHLIEKITKVNSSIPRHTVSRSFNLRSNSLQSQKPSHAHVKPAISTRQLEMEFQQHVDYSKRIKRFTYRENRPVLKMTAMVKINHPRFKRSLDLRHKNAEAVSRSVFEQA